MRIWLNDLFSLSAAAITPASNDASFRRYFRIHCENITYIVMDAPPDREDTRPFITIARIFRKLGLQTPDVLAADLKQGFLLLTDLGTRQYLAELNNNNVGKLYSEALDALLRLHIGGDSKATPLPHYDAQLLHQEMELFRDWFITQYLQLPLNPTEHRVLDEIFAILSSSAQAQPQVLVHRDYHSRNLMVTEHANPGVLDFQDAVIGPITYDLVSLLRDCYISWPHAWVNKWAFDYQQKLQQQGLLKTDTTTFLRWFDLMGVQRHLKAIGIFSRLNLRDGKPGYLKDIPRTLTYILEVSVRYPQLAPLHRLLENKITPNFTKILSMNQ
jgi:aminoglycoside/choline kinase family phosphotransferase